MEGGGGIESGWVRERRSRGRTEGEGGRGREKERDRDRGRERKGGLRERGGRMMEADDIAAAMEELVSRDDLANGSCMQ
eukprot:2717253-Rhodomonas_salina.1